MRTDKDLLYKDEVYAIVGAAMEVHTILGAGFAEAVYDEPLRIEFAQRNIPFEAQKRLIVYYKGLTLQKTYIPDFVCYEKIVVEIKALDNLTQREMAQLLNYLKATGLRLGLLINFGSTGKLEWKRVIV
ncbi:MAG: GxxExxY protein [Anaerolineales bacterium]|nr:GxxExxY protein [Anaerolineales bacterium]